jgi:hypothetical protein
MLNFLACLWSNVKRADTLVQLLTLRWILLLWYFQGAQVKLFAKELQLSGRFPNLAYVYWDERLTSVVILTPNSGHFYCLLLTFYDKISKVFRMVIRQEHFELLALVTLATSWKSQSDCSVHLCFEEHCSCFPCTAPFNETETLLGFYISMLKW